MPTDHIRYDLLTQEALRGVVRQVLVDVAKNGVPGDHHFYVTFDTRLPGVKMSPRLRAQYPEEMRVVLQHQFWDLTVTEEAFEVGLSFGGVPERLSVPFTAVTAFLDPSVQFGLQFTMIVEAASDTAEVAAPAIPAQPRASEASARRSTATGPAVAQPATTSNSSAKPAAPAQADKSDKSDNEPGPPSGGGEVVRFDRFRKK